MTQTVLIIDDSQDDVLITKRVLSRIERAIRVETAHSGEAGLAMLGDGEPLPAAILLDLKMPGMDGIEVLHKIRENERLKEIPVIVVTHSALDSDVEMAYRAGANGVIQKAFNIEQFSKDIESLLERWLKD